MCIIVVGLDDPLFCLVLMYRFDVDQQKLDNYNNKYCSSNGIVRSGTCIAKKTVLEIVMNVSGTCVAIK